MRLPSVSVRARVPVCVCSVLSLISSLKTLFLRHSLPLGSNPYAPSIYSALQVDEVGFDPGLLPGLQEIQFY